MKLGHLTTFGFVLSALLLQGGARAADKVTFGLDWVISGQHAPFFVAKEKGFYAQEGLEVDIVRGYGSADAVKRVAAGNFDIGFGDAGALALARAEGLRVKMVAVIYSNAPYSLVVRNDANIKQPKDLEGVTLAAPAGGAGRAMFPVFAKLAKIDAEKIKWLTIDSASLLPVLIANRVAGIATFYVQRATDEARAAEAGVKVHSIKYADYGLKMYSNGLLATDETIQKKPEILRRFVAATIRGFEHAFANPEEAAKLLVGRHPELSPNLVAEDVVTVSQLARSPEGQQHGFGFMSEEMFVNTRDIVADVFNSEPAKKLDVKTLYTNEFLPGKK
jgi:NitT/TauT family transport system substrate-binding protein